MTTYVVSSGIVSSGLPLGAGDIATVLSGGLTLNTADGGLEQVEAGGIASATAVENGGTLTISAGGSAVSTTAIWGCLLCNPAARPAARCYPHPVGPRSRGQSSARRSPAASNSSMAVAWPAVR